MPAKIVECISKGQRGFKSSEGGTCYIGPKAREQAGAQVTAINISQAKKQGAAWVKKL